MALLAREKEGKAWCHIRRAGRKEVRQVASRGRAVVWSQRKQRAGIGLARRENISKGVLKSTRRKEHWQRENVAQRVWFLATK